MASKQALTPESSQRGSKGPKRGVSRSPTLQIAPIANLMWRKSASISDPKTPTKSGTSDSITLSDRLPPSNNRFDRLQLQEQGIFFDIDDYFDRYPDFQETVNQVLQKRQSLMSVGSAAKMRKEQKEKATLPETEYFRVMADRYIGKSRTVQIEDSLNWVERAYDDDRLSRVGPSTFVKGILPVKSKVPAAKDSAPDFAFGTKPPLPKDQVNIGPQAMRLVMASGTVEHCFLVIENKSVDGVFGDAETQALRSGTALVNARRQLIDMAAASGEDQPQELGPDYDSYVYSIAWQPGFAKLFVHWCEIEKDKTYWHTNNLNAYALDKAGDMQEFRRDIHSVLDWGLGAARLKRNHEIVRAIASQTWRTLFMTYTMILRSSQPLYLHNSRDIIALLPWTADYCSIGSVNRLWTLHWPRSAP